MGAEIYIPIISQETGVKTITRYLTKPEEAIRETAQRMQGENPRLLKNIILGTLWIMNTNGEDFALSYLKSGLCFVENYSEQAKKEGIPIISVDSSTIWRLEEQAHQVHQEFQQIGHASILAKNRIYNELETYMNTLSINNPGIQVCAEGFKSELKSRTTAFNPDELFIMGGAMSVVHKALLMQLDSKQTQEEIETPNQFAVNESLIEIILNRRRFTENSLKFIGDKAPDWTEYLKTIEYQDFFCKEEYELFTSLVVDTKAREFTMREIPFPKVSLVTIESSALGQETIEDIEKEDPPLYEAYTYLKIARRINPVGPRSVEALFATIDAYRNIKRQRESEFWEGLMS